MSKKYIESMNKITVDDKLKKRILQKVSEVKEEENNTNITTLNRSRCNKVWTKSVGLVAACCAFVVCTSLNSKFPELFNKGNVNSSNENVENDNSEIDNSKVSDESIIAENNINSEDMSVNTEGTSTDNVNSTSKEDNNYINNTGKEKRNSVENNQTYQENADNSNGNNSISNRNESDMNNNAQAVISQDHNYSSENAEVIGSENNNENYGTAVSDYVVSNDSTDASDEKNTSASTGSKLREMPGNMKEEFEIPEALKNDAEITYTLLVSEDIIEVGYKDESSEDGVLRISSHKIDEPLSNDYSSMEILKADNCEAVLMSNEDNTKRIAEWEFNHKFYTLSTDADFENEEIIKIIESCR